MRFIVTFIFLAGIYTTSNAQAKYDSSKRSSHTPVLAIKISPQHLAAFYPTLQIALEHKVYKDISLQYDYGYVLNYKDNASDEYSDKRGYKAKIELRYYAWRFSDHIQSYVATEAFQNHVDFNRKSVFGIDCPTGDCDYFEYKTFTVQYRENGFAVKYGFLFYLDQAKHLFIDINGGLTTRNIHYTHVGKPSGTGIIDYGNDFNAFWRPDETSRFDYGLVIGARAAYRFR